MDMESKKNQPVNLDARHKVQLLLWVLFLSTIGIYFVISLFIQARETENQNRMLTYVVAAIGILMVLGSLVVRQRFLALSVERQEISLAQTGFIAALALCETAALLALVDLLTTGNHYYYLLMIVAFIGTLLHFPRREQLLAASYKQQT